MNLPTLRELLEPLEDKSEDELRYLCAQLARDKYELVEASVRGMSQEQADLHRWRWYGDLG